PIHDYILRRRLTQAAQQLVHTQKPILEIALEAGYQSQQAFTSAFKGMYKQTPRAFRKNNAFYPLQWKFTGVILPQPANLSLAWASLTDLDDWMALSAQTVSGLPGLEENSHRKQIQVAIRQHRAIVIRDQTHLIGALVFSQPAATIEFLAIHPQYSYRQIAAIFLDFLIRNRVLGPTIKISTFRANDKADPGQRKAYEQLGFTASELLVEFGYPTQRMLLQVAPTESKNG
ncbi:helix-turn-helix domain-containing protein, partial [uncultured Dubosiella sp.]